MANSVVKSFSSFAVNEGLLAKAVDAVKQGERDARRTGQVRSFEIYYHGQRSDLVMGRIVILPAKIADAIEDFPLSLLYGCMVRELNGETLSDVLNYKLGEGEFDEYSKKDLAAIKEKLFTDAEGTLRSIVMFVPAWGGQRDQVAFKFVKDDERLAMLLRHMVYGAYFDPRLSSAFESLSTEVETEKFDVTDVTPKLNFPFLAENILKQYPDLQPGDSKTASARRPKIVIAEAKTDEFSKEETLEPGELAVLNELAEDIKAKVNHEVSTSEEIAKQAGGSGAELDARMAKFLDDVIATGQASDYYIEEIRYGVQAGYITLADGMITKSDQAATITEKGKNWLRLYRLDHKEAREIGHDDEGAKTGLRDRPDYGESTSATSVANDAAEKEASSYSGLSKEARVKLASKIRELVNQWINDNGGKIPERLFVNVDQSYVSTERPNFGYIYVSNAEAERMRKTAPAAPAAPDRNQVIRNIISEYAEKNGELPERLYVVPETGDASPNPPRGHYNYVTVSREEGYRMMQQPKAASKTAEIVTYSAWRAAVKKSYPNAYFEGDKDICQAFEKKGGKGIGEWEGDKGRVTKKAAAAIQVLERAGSKLLVKGATLIAVSPTGYQETPILNGRKLKWAMPNRFAIAFRQSAETLMRNPRVAAQLKVADVPQTFEEIWGDKMEDLGPAPEVPVPGEGAHEFTHTETQTPPAESHEAPAEKKDGDDEPTPPTGGGKPEEKKDEPAEEKKPWEKDAPAKTASISNRLEKLRARRDPDGLEAKIGSCRACTRAVTAATGSEVGPDVFLHAACQARGRKLAANGIIAYQVLAAHYPDVLRKTADREYIDAAIEELKDHGRLNTTLDFIDMTPVQQQAVFEMARQLKNQGRKIAEFDLFIPGQVAEVFAPDVLRETVDYPSETYSPMISDVGPVTDGAYVPTSPTTALGIGNDGKPQVLDGAPLRKEDDIRGYMFNDEFYQQYDSIDSGGMRAASVLTGLKKTADAEQFKAQFAEFLKKAMGEVAASFIAAFKVTSRPMMNKVPGIGEIQLQNIEQNLQQLNAYNVPTISSRVRFLVSKLNDSDIASAINDGWAQAAVWNEDADGGYNYEVFVRPESLDQDTLVLKYSFVVGTKGL